MMTSYDPILEEAVNLKDALDYFYTHCTHHTADEMIILLKLTNHSDYADQLFRYPWSTNIVLNILIIRTNYSDESDQ